jgi:hypothetical protein
VLFADPGVATRRRVGGAERGEAGDFAFDHCRVVDEVGAMLTRLFDHEFGSYDAGMVDAFLGIKTTTTHRGTPQELTIVSVLYPQAGQ